MDDKGMLPEQFGSGSFIYLTSCVSFLFYVQFCFLKLRYETLYGKIYSAVSLSCQIIYGR